MPWNDKGPDYKIPYMDHTKTTHYCCWHFAKFVCIHISSNNYQVCYGCWCNCYSVVWKHANCVFLLEKNCHDSLIMSIILDITNKQMEISTKLNSMIYIGLSWITKLMVYTHDLLYPRPAKLEGGGGGGGYTWFNLSVRPSVCPSVCL